MVTEHSGRKRGQRGTRASKQVPTVDDDEAAIMRERQGKRSDSTVVGVSKTVLAAWPLCFWSILVSLHVPQK